MIKSGFGIAEQRHDTGEEKPLKAGKKLLALLLTVCMLLCMLPTVAFASGSDYLKIAMLDSGRKYFRQIGSKGLPL